MAQLDNFKSVALLFTGAFLISIAVIAFLNIETQSRSTHGTKIKNENVFELLGKKLSDTISALRERNAYRRSILYQILISGNTTSVSRRKLLHFLDKSNRLADMLEHRTQNGTLHRLRHEKKIRRLTEIQLMEKGKNSSFWREKNLTGNDAGRDKTRDEENNVSAFLNKSVNNQTLRWFRWTANVTTKNESGNANQSGDQVLREKFQQVHQNCYTMNDVLEIIAVTCLVNFIFWFLIITCVNVFTRNQKMSKSDSCESLASVGSRSEYEIHGSQLKKLEEEASPRGSHCRRSFVEDYVNSLMMESAENGSGNAGEIHGSGRHQQSQQQQQQQPQQQQHHHHHHHHRIHHHHHHHHRHERPRERGDADGNGNKPDSRARFVNFPNIFLEMIALDTAKAFDKKKRRITDDQVDNSLNSLSMENLIF